MAKKRPSIDEFLAAPDSLKLSEQEQKKAHLRKARADAERARLKAGKRKNKPTVEDLLADLVRAAEDEATNPHWKFKALSAKRYQLYGWYPFECIEAEFGQFNHALEVAGLRDQPGTRQKKRARAYASRSEHAGRYLQRWVLPHCHKFPELHREISNGKLVLTISDTHGTYLDPFTWYVFLCAVRDLNPDVIVFNGDMVEGSEISSHPKIPGLTVPLQLDLDFVRELFRQVRRYARPDCRIVWTAGNHFLDRMARYLTQVATAFAGLRNMRLDKLVELDGLDIELAQGGTIASPAGTEMEATGILLFGFYLVHHGVKLGKTPAINELVEAGRSGQSGHVHRASIAYGAEDSRQALTWMSTPAACGERATQAYMHNRTCTGHQKGFGVAYLFPGNRVHHYPVVTDGGIACFEGFVYQADPKFGKDPDPSTLWVADMELPKAKA